ncbi:SDR family oxidoreductase [Actinomadura sp. DC4]|uniref:SDR family oxidoreductase n=1 Tax=Actinomadura sp. DC4 TaxID=3055069 RepID=UPI0025AF785B|nr:SDR family oxidoreductase [Actinomadura sp. DC4]MDN3353764.1 SDR family oxidoreductase [Actinomadura sp. DC4]
MTGQRALVTGGSRGVGAAVSARLAADGAAVAVHCRADTATAEAVVAGLPGDGHIVVSGDIADPGQAAVHAMAQSLAVSLAPYDIAVSAVAPGFVRTDMTEAMLSGPAGDGIRAQSPYDRVAEPEDVASAVAWLALADARWASGAVIDLNGASYLR